ncbi:TPA: DUF11 domain-containing protein [Bacillus anthracis]|uniref:Conserved repeat domain protein n=1 Tax=Bacillus anthracis TaxID=1392 RepID=A0A2P0HHL3_BACAN|nr:conserved repeat domain protein [Bacillus anthracis str. Ames]AAT55757.1 conserved repeat domain protein [Bacillus anthracis str. Sterne]ACP13423.1 conserved repeat domain protein [Bacillus anthracis str. CDC 684]AFH84924.1 repeat domain protein [Bacillus anthracis str. H9401]AHE85107.1 hypothetical protein A16R_37660 [Bacillus anthracis str. A16R]AHE90987.1 hypothetical protein A16_37260 [Bacillus anthracis str. A16]AIK52579.1 hypothetical protein DJ45_2275 [Bacillus anthracis]AIK63286.1
MAIATIGSRLTYTIVVQNTGTLPAQNVTFTDPLPAGTTFVPNSVTVDGVATAGILLLVFPLAIFLLAALLQLPFK